MIQSKHKRSFINQCKTFVLILGLATACGNKKETNESLHKAFKLHKEAIKIRQMVSDKMDKLKAKDDSLSMEADKKILDSVSFLLKAWDEQLVEVPGFEEEHDHSGHDHSHGKESKLTPKQHLEVQQYLLEEIKEIAKRVDQLKTSN